MGSLIFSKFRKLFVLYVIFPISVAGSGLSWTGGVITVPESGKKAESDRTEKSSQDIIHVLFDPSKIYPGGYLFQVTIGVKFEGDNFQEFEGIEKRVARSIENLIKHQLSTFSPSLKKLLLRSIERINAPVLFLTYWLYFNPGGQDIYGPLEIQLNQLKAKHVANLRHGKATLFFKSIEDVNECSSGLSMCDPRADCFNAFGFYSCRCIEGFEDRSLNGSGIECIANEKSEPDLKHSLGFNELLIAIILCVVLILAIILTFLSVMSKRRKRVSTRNENSVSSQRDINLHYFQKK